MNRAYHSGIIDTLHSNEVFVFGSNESGFHGAGAAGMACRGDSRNTWRQDQWFLKAINSCVGSDKRIGQWAVYGISRGYQEGKIGKSYAIATVIRPGARRSISLIEILEQLKELGKFARMHSDLTFFCCIHGGGYNGYSHDEIKMVYKTWVNEDLPPQNILLPESMK